MGGEAGSRVPRCPPGRHPGGHQHVPGTQNVRKTLEGRCWKRWRLRGPLLVIRAEEASKKFTK